MSNPFQNPEPGAPPVAVQRQRGQYFHFALPAGWRVQENTNGVCLTSSDGSASIMSVGLVGMLQPFTPDQFMGYVLNMYQMTIVGMLSGQALPPPPGCSSSAVFEIVYHCGGAVAQGIVTCHIALGYNQCNGSLTLAAASQALWPQYRSWLPQVAAEVQPAGSQTYMASTVAANNRRATEEFGHRLQETNDYINQLHQHTTDARWASQDQQNFYRRENLGTAVAYFNPYENRIVEMPAQYNYYWVSRQGHVFGSDDPRDDPRIGSTEEWSELGRYRP